MPLRRWQGGATAVAQVDHLTPGGTIEAGDRFIVTLTAEDGTSSQSLNIEATGTTVLQTCADIQAACAASNETLFAAIIWTEDTSKVIATARVPGVPFNCSVSTTESGGGAADAQTFVRASSVASVGPNDWNSVGNWVEGAVPIAADDVVIANSQYSILYGLDQSSIALTSISVGDSFTGDIGDRSNQYYLQIDSTDVKISGAEQNWFDGTYTTVRCDKGLGEYMLRLKGDVGTVRLVGPAVRGKCVVANSSVLDNFYCMDAPGATWDIGESVTSLDTVKCNSGQGVCRSAVATSMEAFGSAAITHTGGNVTNVEVKTGGRIDYQAGGLLGSLTIDGGVFTLENHDGTDLTISSSTLSGGRFIRNNLANVSYTADTSYEGGAFVPEIGTDLA